MFRKFQTWVHFAFQFFFRLQISACSYQLIVAAAVMHTGTNPGSTFPPMPLPHLSQPQVRQHGGTHFNIQSAVVSSPRHGHHRSLLRHAFLCSRAPRHFYEIRLQSQRGQVVRQSLTCRSQVHCPHCLLAHWSLSYSSRASFLTFSSLCVPQDPSFSLCFGSSGLVCLGSFYLLRLVNQILSLKEEI